MHDATALNETRTLSFHHTHSDEDLTVTFKRDGRYDEEALKKINHFLRDWRSQDSTTMDRHLFDILWEVYRDVDAKKPIQIISAYRSPATNAMLRRRSSGVARFSQHMLGHAMDFYIPDVPLEQIRAAGLRLQRGGVGFYPTSGSPFVHLDTGSIRHWPRMTHDQLAKVFPDGRTVHLPSDGGPMKGYELARADIERRGNGDDSASVGKMPNLFAALFRGGKSNDEDDEGTSVPAKPEKAAPASVMAAAAPKSADPVPTPRSKRPVAATLQLASADAQIVPAPKGKSESRAEQKQAAQASTEPKPQTPADIINSRGFWDDVPKAANQASPAQIAALRARQVLAATTDPQPTASVTELVQQGDGLRPGRLLAGRPPPRRRRLRAGPAAFRPSDAQCRRRRDRHQYRGRQGTAGWRTGPGQRGRDLDPSRRCPGQQHLDAGGDAGAEREQCDVDDRARRHRDDPDAPPLRQAAGRDRHDLLGRSDDGHDLRPLHGIGDRATADAVVRDAHRRAALSASSPHIQCRPRESEAHNHECALLEPVAAPAVFNASICDYGSPDVQLHI